MGAIHGTENNCHISSDLADLMGADLCCAISDTIYLRPGVRHASQADAQYMMTYPPCYREGTWIHVTNDMNRKTEESKGLDPVGCDFFPGTIQGSCPNVAPYSDQRTIETVKKMGLTDDLNTTFEAVNSNSVGAARLQEAPTSQQLDG